MRHKEMMCAAFILTLGLFMLNAQTQAADPLGGGILVNSSTASQMSTDESIGSIHGDLTAAGLPGVQEASVAWRDYDDDGDLDLLLMASKGADYITRVYRNEGTAAFSVVAECVTVDGVTTCEGDQSAGVQIPSTTPIELWVQNLTTDITPADSVSGIEATVVGAGAQDGPNLEIHFTDGGHAIVTQGDGAHGISGTSFGANGYRGGDDHSGWVPIFHMWSYGGNGGTGHVGGGVLVANDGTITTNGNQAHGVAAVSYGGTGGHGGHASAMAYAEGGNGGTGGFGDTVTVVRNGRLR